MRTSELVELAKELTELESLKGREQDLYFLKRERARLDNKEPETFAEKSEIEQFNVYFDKLASKMSDLNKSTLDDKKELLKKAHELVEDKTSNKNVAKLVNDLWNNFKHLPRVSKEVDDELFGEFKAILKEVDEIIASRKERKVSLISKAKEVLTNENMKQAISKMDALMDEWKAVGPAGRDDEALWNEFSEIRKEFSVKRKEHFENMKVVIEERATKKEELIKKVKYITSEAYFTDEEIKEIKSIEKEFRNIGFAGKDKDQPLWDEMQAAIRKYFDEMKFYK